MKSFLGARSCWKLSTIVAVCVISSVQSENCEPNKGKKQSPINIDTNMTIPKYYNKTKYSSHYYQEKPYDLVNEGNAFELHLVYPNFISVEGGPMIGFYAVRYLRIHQPSEHTIDNEHFPLEIQFICERGSNTKKGDDYVGISYLFQIGPEDNAYIADILDAIPKIRKEGDSKQLWFTFNYIFGFPTRHYFSYQGSLTTSPYKQSVLWIISTLSNQFEYLDPRISRKQVEMFKKAVMNNPEMVNNNNRCIQNLNERPVYKTGH